MTTPSPVPEGTPVVLSVVEGHAGRWIDPADPGAQPAGEVVAPRVRCSLFTHGHHVHFIQADHGIRTPSTVHTLLAVDGGELVVADEEGRTQRWWVHDTDFARAALLLDERPAVHLHGLGLARLGSTLFFPCVDGTHRPEPCAWHSSGAAPRRRPGPAA